jgi:erythromycin esterase-like protein
MGLALRRESIMADRTIIVSENPLHKTDPQSAKLSSRREGKLEENGHPSANAAGATTATDTARQAEQRAEELVDHAAQRVAEFTALVKRKLAQVAARAREEVEDIWAEAQSLRRGEK